MALIALPPATALDPDLAREERASLTYMFRGRLLVLGLLAVWVVATLPLERSAAYLGVLALFFLFGAIPYALSVRGHGGAAVIGFFLLLDAAVLSYLLIVPNPYGMEGWSPQMNLRAPGFLYLGLFLVYMALSYRTPLVVWAGVAAVISWSVGNLWVISLPETQFFSSRDILDAGLSLQAALDRVLDPYAVGFARFVNQIVFLIVVTLILTLTVWRSRRLVLRQVASERQRFALSRYFSPNLVRELTETGRSLGAPKVQPVAVLFADMVGFTAISERLKPGELVDLLREFHGRLARIALDHGGTVDKYIGDAIMVHFGTPETCEDDAARALRCAAAMLAEIDEWNAARRAAGLETVGMGVGLHYGEVIVGNIGDETRLEYTVLGDAVNVASRLEELTRKLGARFVTSDALIAAAIRSGAAPKEIMPDLAPAPPKALRGRAEPVAIWRALAAATESAAHG
ncbi:MAG: adenylate/guanylate cyclase domain-containing protein [Pseudomonadota bacterium]